MASPKFTDMEFIAAWKEHQSAKGVADHFNMSVRGVCERRRRVEKRHGIALPVFNPRNPRDNSVGMEQKARVSVSLPNGMAVVFSDAHYYPGEASTAHRGLVHVLSKLKPAIVVCNGDAFDGATISRHPRIGWDKKPNVEEELEAVSVRLCEIEKVSGQAKMYWPLGNHDGRYETYLADKAPQYQGVSGFSLKDKFPLWKPCWSLMINENTMIKHRYSNGIHAAHTNTLKAGTSIVTGHLHSLKVTPWTDYRGDRYGVDTGMLADPYGEQFEDYMEDNPRSWRSGFAVLTFVDSKLMPPELAQVVANGKLFFRGEILDV